VRTKDRNQPAPAILAKEDHGNFDSAGVHRYAIYCGPGAFERNGSSVDEILVGTQLDSNWRLQVGDQALR
jgi:hypothetical protein